MALTLQINYWTLGGFENRRPVADVLQDAKDMGYDGVELAFEADGVLCPATTEAECRGYRSAADRLGLRLRTLASGYYWQKSFGHPEAEARAAAMAFTERYLERAGWIGAETILVIPGAVAVPWASPAPVARYDEVWDRATRCLWKLLPKAEKAGVAIGLENVWNWFLADPAAMRAFVDQFRSPWIGVYFDVANCLINGYPEHWLRWLGHRVKAVHAKNFKRNDDCGGGLHGFGDDLLEGDVDWPAVVSALEDIDYAGPVTAEMIPFSRLPDLVLPDRELARDTAPKLRRVMAETRG